MVSKETNIFLNTNSYYKKLALRDQIAILAPEDIINESGYNIWDMKYISTTDEEDAESDNGSEESEDSSQSEEEDERNNDKENNPLFKKNVKN